MKKTVILLLNLMLVSGCAGSAAASSPSPSISTQQPEVQNIVPEEPSSEPTDHPSADPEGFSNEELVKRAGNYYQKHNDYLPPIIEVDSVDGNEVTIHLYEIKDDHTATYDWYTIDRMTGTGENILGEQVDLSDPSLS